MRTTKNHDEKSLDIRKQINALLDDMELGYGMRKHLAKLFGTHLSIVTNALNRQRTASRDIRILCASKKYLSEIKAIFDNHRIEVCKRQHKND